MAVTLDFFFSIASTYTYLAVNRAQDVADREGVKLNCRPFNVRAIMVEQNNRPFVGKPVKMKYMWRDLERRAQRHGIPFKSIPPYPIDPQMLANRVAFVASQEGWCPEFAREAYRAWFLDGKLVGEVESIEGVLSRIGKDGKAVIARADADELRAQFDAETERVKAIGIFGSPTFAYGDEIFWGDDRLEDAIDWAKAHPR